MMAIIAIVVVFGAVGTFMLVRSKASGCTSYTYREGRMNNNCVKQIQIMTNYFNFPGTADKSYTPIAEDGDFGPKTKEAVKKFQANYNLTADGVVGPNTWKGLCTQTNRHATFALAKKLLDARQAASCKY